MNGTMIFWDRRNSRARIISHDLLTSDLLRKVKTQASTKGIGKIISFTPAANLAIFLAEDFVLEGTIKGFFRGQPAVCCSYFVDPLRSLTRNSVPNSQLPGQPGRNRILVSNLGSKPYLVRDAQEKDVAGIVRLFRYVFQSYPSPVFEKDYILLNMQEHSVQYKIAVHNKDIIGVAAAETDTVNFNAEMTDCVTYPLYRNRGVLGVLLSELEKDLGKQDFICLYTLCRAANPAVNKVFARLGYEFSGCLVNNCHICGSYEDMNVLVKILR